MTDASDTSTLTYVALPPDGHGPGILVLHAWWGLNDFFRGVCDRLAAAGFVVAAPDLFEGQIATTPDEAERLLKRPRREPTQETVFRAVAELRAHPAVTSRTIGVIGFSFGGGYALLLAQQADQPIGATVVFYEAWPEDYSRNQRPIQGHYAESDDFVADDDRVALMHSLVAAGRTADFHVYPNTGHWFVESDRPDAYDPAAAELAWQRTIAFLRQHVQ